MKLGYCYKCDTVIIPWDISYDPMSSCKCGNIIGCYMESSAVGFLVEDKGSCKCIGIHNMLLLGKPIEEKLKLIETFSRLEIWTNYLLCFPLKIVWDKLWYEAIDIKETSEGTVFIFN